MRRLSISKAWDESKAIVARDGRLFVSVALALIALPTTVSGLINPGGVTRDQPLWVDAIILIVSLVALAGQLALIRLALGPSITVGGAIGHGFRRMPIYLLAAILILCGMLLLAVPFVLLLGALGVPLNPQTRPPPQAALVMLAYLAVLFYFIVRLIMAAPAASAEPIGPVRILRRAWALTSGHWWQLFGFLLMFFIGAVVLLVAAQAAIGLAVTLLFGPIEPMSAGALAIALVRALVNAVITTLFAVMLARIYVQLAGSGETQASVPSTGT